jgi:hypothetical protein
VTVSLAIECLVAVLLLVTIGYCGLLNRRLKLLRGDEEMLKATIGELITATEIAERAIMGLKATVVEAEASLGERLRQAERVSGQIGHEMQAAEAVLQRLGQISALAREAGLAQPARERATFHRSPERAA